LSLNRLRKGNVFKTCGRRRSDPIQLAERLGFDRGDAS
jgi:hypothetical protein